MLRVSLVAWAVIAATSIARAAPAEYTLPALPEGWNDITTEAMKQPAMATQREAVIKQGGTFDAKMYVGEGAGMLITRSEFDGASPSKAELDGFMAGFRSSSSNGAKELSWNEERTNTMLAGVQRIDRDGEAAMSKAYAGFTLAGKLRTLGFFCYGKDEICAPLLAKISIDDTGLRPLDSLNAQPENTSTAYRAGRITGMVLVALLVIGFGIRSARRAKAAK